MDLSNNLKERLKNFARNNDFVRMYKEYNWRNDSWEDGFPEILQLEIKMTQEAKSNVIRKEHILSVAKWGQLKNIQNVRCSESMFLPIFQKGILNEKIITEPSFLIELLQKNIKGFGPTYLSKVLRFALPTEFGAIDTRITRVFGKNGLLSDPWFTLKVKYSVSKYCIPKKQSGWPGEYSTWINILRFFANYMNNFGSICPHPEEYSSKKLRQYGIWTCADIEMSLFSYASKILGK
jgi:hypothetical protein